MNTSVPTPSKTPGRPLPTWIKAIALILILVSIGLRSTNLDLKPFWEDEVDTMVHVSGYQRQTIAKQLNQQRLTVGDLAKYRDPQSGQSWLETLRALTTTAEQPPLYFVILRAWSVIFGHSVAALRSMSVVFSVLGLGVFYLLGRALFPTDSATGDAAGWGSMTLAALSPVLLRYAQETRAYSLWVVWLGLSTWLLLRAWRSPSKRNWSLYGITLILAFHTHLLTLFVIVGHGMTLIIHGILNRWRQTPLKGWILTVVPSGICMIPWLAVLLSKQGSIQTRARWLSTSRPLDSLIRAWTLGFSKTWLDISGQQALFWSFISLVGFMGVAIATVYLWRHSQRDSIVTILSLTLVPTLMILAMDIFSGGQRSTVHRYFIPAYIGLLTLCGSALGSALAGRVGQRRLSVKTLGLWSGTALLVLLNLFSIGQLHQSPFWGRRAQYVPQFAEVMAEDPNAVLVSDLRLALFLALAYALPPDQELVWLNRYALGDGDRPALPLEDNDAIFLFSPSEDLEAAMTQQRQNPLPDPIAEGRRPTLNLRFLPPVKP